MPRRILHISTRLILGGSQENTLLSCEGQADLGHDVHLAFGPIYGPEGSMLDRARAHGSIADHTVPDLVRQLDPMRDRRALKQLKTLITDLNPDIVHTHSSKAGILGRLAAHAVRTRTRRRLGIVHTIHGPPFMPIEGGLLNRAKTGLLNTAYTLAERHAAKRCDVIVSVADAMTEQFRARGIGRPEQFVTVRSGINTTPYTDPPTDQTRDAVRAKWGLAENDFVIGTVARLAQHKGHDDLLDALHQDLLENPHWKLLWVGDGWWADRLIEKAGQLKVANQIVRTGLVPPADVPGLIRAMDVLAHPSYREGLPRTVPQALLCGVCPVAYDADGTREACIDGQTGRLIPVGDTDALRSAIHQLAQDPEPRLRLAEAGRAMALKEFSAEAMVRHLEHVYDDALARAKP